MNGGMFPYNAAPPRGRAAHGNGLLPPPAVPRYYGYHHLSRAGVNSVSARGLDCLPPYEWKPTPAAAQVFPPPRAPSMTNGRKRQNDDYSPHAVKRQRFDSPSYPSAGPPFVRAPPPCRPDHVVAGSSRSGFDCSYPSPQVPAVPQTFPNLQIYGKDKLSGQMLDLFEACQQQSSDLARKEMCRARLQEDIQQVYETGRLYLTGSSMNGLSCRSSDADLCLVLKGKKRHNPIQVLSILQKFFKTLSYVERTQLIKAKVPILRFREKDSDLEFDLNINNTVGIRNTFLLRSYAYADLRIRPLILVVKKWAWHSRINDASKGTLSSYALVLMVVHYLQTLKVLPCLQKDYPECFNPNMDIDSVPEGPKNIPPYNSRNQSSLGELFLGFLKYYDNFRWDNQVISVREARTLPKAYSREWSNKFICVEEPFERNNVARAVHDRLKFNVIKSRFSQSHLILRQRMDLDCILPIRDTINKESSRT